MGIRTISSTATTKLFAPLLLLLSPGLVHAQETQGTPEQDGEPAAPDAAVEAASIPPLIDTKAFAGRPAFWNPEISPDGSVISLFQLRDDTLQMTVFDIAENKAISAIGFGKGSSVGWTRWVDEDRMLMNVRTFSVALGMLLPVSRIYIAYPKEGRAEPLIEDQKSFDGGDLLYVAPDGEYALIAHGPPVRRNVGERGFYRTFMNYEPGVYRYELKSGGAMTTVLEPKKGIDIWQVDTAGEVRLGMGWRRKRLSLFYRDTSDEEFEQIARIKRGETDKFFEAVQIITGSSKGYVLDENEEGRVGLRVFDYKTREVVDTFYEHPEWDLERVWLDDNGEPLAVFYTDDRERIVWFDDGYKKTYEDLEKTLGEGNLAVVSYSADNRKMLVSSSSEADPGLVYTFDADARTLAVFAPYRTEIDHRLLARPKPISYTARDGTQIRGYLTLPKGRDPKNLPLIINPHGGPYGVRDQLYYNDEVQLLANRGYAVLQPNYRGSGGYGTDFFELGTGEIGQKMQDDLDDAMDWAVAEGIADPERVCIVGASYGGYAAIWGVVRNPERYRCAASWAGVTDWNRMLKDDRRQMSREAGKRWAARLQGEDEELDLKEVSPARMERLGLSLQRPILLAHGTRDTIVPFNQYERMQKAARNSSELVTSLVIEDERHSFSNSENEQKWYDALDAFLAEHNPADQASLEKAEQP